MKVLFPGLLVLLFVFTSCQSDSKPTQKEDKKTTYANFYLRYLQVEKKVKGEVYFSTSENPEKSTAIEYENGVFFDGGSMEMKKAVGRNLYRSKRASEFKSSYEFEINPKGTNSSKQIININPISSFKIENGIRKSKGFQLTWEGSNLRKEEALVLLFTDEKNRAVNIEVKGPTTTPSISISAKELTKLNIGQGALYLVRKVIGQRKMDGMQVNSISEFYTRAIDVKIVD